MRVAKRRERKTSGYLGPSLRSWRYCKRPRNKVLDKRAAKPRGEWGEGVPLPILLAASPESHFHADAGCQTRQIYKLQKKPMATQ